MDHPPPLHDILFLITRATAIGVETARAPTASALVPPRPCRCQRTSTISSSTTSSLSSFASAESAPAPPRPRRRTVPLGACSITLHSLMGSSETWLPRSSS